MVIVMTSANAILRNGLPDPEVVSVLKSTQAAGHPVGVVSNHIQPQWFASAFAGSSVPFLHVPVRQNGQVIAFNAQKFSLAPHDVLVLAANDADVQMGKNGNAVLVAAGWSQEPQVAALGIRVDNAQQLREVIELTAAWQGQWWFSGSVPRYSVRALANLSEYSVSAPQQIFAQKLKATVKGGGPRLSALLAITARSLLTDLAGAQSQLVFGVYPSSNSANDDTEILSDFTHRLRTTVSRVRYAKKEEPLFIRHKPSSKRSAGGGGIRTDPSEQLETLHLNPYYRTSSRLTGKHVIVVDDCTTYGVSFGVAAALLRKAGAAAVTGIALGKFGNQLRSYEIDVHTNPFVPIVKSGFTLISSAGFAGVGSQAAQQSLLTLVP